MDKHDFEMLEELCREISASPTSVDVGFRCRRLVAMIAGHLRGRDFPETELSKLADITHPLAAWPVCGEMEDGA